MIRAAHPFPFSKNLPVAHWSNTLMPISRLLLSLLCAAALSACAMAAPRTSTAAAEDLLAADRAFAAKSAATTAAEAFYYFVTEDSIQLPATGKPMEGREAIRMNMSVGPPIVLLWQPQFAEVASSADLGWTWGEWQAMDPNINGKRLSYGRYINIWKKQSDGSWKVRLDMGNVAKEAAPTASGE